MLLIDRMRRDGHDVPAERLLVVLRVTLATWQEHQDEILRELEWDSRLLSR